jgi:hypothetical protein
VFRTRPWAQAVLASTFLLLAATAGRAGEAAVDISGTWVLNAELSDDPREVIQARMEKMRGRGYGNPGGSSGGGPSGGRPPTGGAPGGEPEQLRQRLRQLEPSRRIVIIQDDSWVTVVAEGRDTLSVVPDGKKHMHKTAIGDMEIVATWKDLSLELRTKGREGRELKRWYRINDDGRLEVVTELTLPPTGEKIDIVMRYDEAKLE